MHVRQAGFGLVLASIVSACCPMAAGASPFIPADDAQVLEQLPASPLDPGTHQLQTLRRQLSKQPDSLALAIRVATAFIDQGRRLSDPRYYGYAQAALAPWWDGPTPPVPVLVLRATIRQHNHDFDSALADLSLVLEADPQNAQAWLTRALILQVRGDYAAAKDNCMQVLQLAAPLVGVTCLSGVGSLTGEAQKSENILHAALTRADAGDTSVRLWALTVLAEGATRRGDPHAAEAYFQQALALGVSDDYLLGAYADFLLDQGHSQRVIDLLANATRADALLLRLAIAEQDAGAPTRDEHVETLRARFAASHLRGEAVHRREEARFTLHLGDDPRAALALAQQNWRVQHEPWDARVLLECAIATGDHHAAQPVLEFLQQSHLEDVELAQLSERLRTVTP